MWGQRHCRLLSCGADVGLGEDDSPAGEMTGEEVGMRLPGPWTPGRPGCPTKQDTPASGGGHALRALEGLKVTALWPEESWERAARREVCCCAGRSLTAPPAGGQAVEGLRAHLLPPIPDPHHPPQERGCPRSKFCPSHVGGAGEPDLRVFSDAEQPCSGATSWKSHSSRADTVSRHACSEERVVPCPRRAEEDPSVSVPSLRPSAQHGGGAP